MVVRSRLEGDTLTTSWEETRFTQTGEAAILYLEEETIIIITYIISYIINYLHNIIYI